MGAWRAEPQTFESEVSGRAVVRLHAGEGAPPEHLFKDAWLAFCRIDEGGDSSSAAAAAALSAAGFTPVETLVTLECALGGDAPAPAHKPLAPAAPADHAAVTAIARSAFTHDRFHADARTPRRIADELKARWAENGLNGRNSAALVARGPSGAPEGFVFIDLKDAGRTGVIDLIAVDPAQQGRGCGRRLVLGACAWARAAGAQVMRVGTQAENAASVRVYQACGFAPVRRQITFHRTAPRIAVVVFARMDSARLPGKALADLGGAPVLARVLARARRAGFGPGSVIGPVIATSERAVDDPIAQLAQRMGADVFRGAGEDVLGRAAACAGAHDLDAIVRISGDSPFIDPALIRRAAGIWLAAPDLDLVTNVHPRTYPPGQSAEVISRALLGRLDAEVTDAALREHVTRAVYDRPGGFRLHNFESGAGNSAAPAGPAGPAGIDLAVDDEAGLARARALMNALGPDAETAGLDDVTAAAQGLAPPHRHPGS